MLTTARCAHLRLSRAAPQNCNPNYKLRHVIARGRGASQNGASPPDDAGEWETGGLPEYMQEPGQCESWEETLRRGAERRSGSGLPTQNGGDLIWQTIRREAEKDAAQEPLLSSFLYASILSHDNFERSLAFVLSNRLSDATFLSTELFEVFYSILRAKPEISEAALADLRAVRERDPACLSYSQALLHFKGFHAIQAHRIAHELWSRGRKVMACALQSRMSEVFAVDIHPAARMGKGILLDHGTGVVIGETAVLGNNVSILQNVTLGGTGKVHGDRHPKVSDNVLIGASASILGNIQVGKGAQVAAGSLVLKPVPPHTLVAGSPAKEIGKVQGIPALTMEQWGSNKEVLKSNLEHDPFAVSPRAPGQGAGSAAGGQQQQEQRGSLPKPMRPRAASESARAAAQQPAPSPRSSSPDGDGVGPSSDFDEAVKKRQLSDTSPPEYLI